MYKVYYRYMIRLEGCGCCSYSANELRIYNLETGMVVEDDDRAHTFSCEEDLVEFLVDVYKLEKDKIVVDKDSEYL